jgi:hypothetical protein
LRDQRSLGDCQWNSFSPTVTSRCPLVITLAERFAYRVNLTAQERLPRARHHATCAPAAAGLLDGQGRGGRPELP